MRPVILLALFAGSTPLLLGAQQRPARPAAGQSCQFRVEHIGRAGHQAVVGADTNYYGGGGVVITCVGTSVRMASDSVAFYGRGRNTLIEFIGGVKYRDTTVTMDADRGTYYRAGERWEARGNVVRGATDGRAPQESEEGRSAERSMRAFFRSMKSTNASRAIKSVTTDEPHLPGAVLATDNPLVGVLVEQSERRLIAVQSITAGTILFRIEGFESRTPSKYSVQIGRDRHLDQRGARDATDRVRRFYWRYMNHGCEPTTRIVDREVVALRDIAPLEAVSFDYNTTEYDMAEPFQCRCGAPSCVGLVRGARHLTAARRAQIAHLLPDYLK